MTDILSAEDRQQILDLMEEYFWLIDHGQAGVVAELFTPTASLTFGPGAPAPGTTSGDAIKVLMENRQKLTVTTRHALSNVRLVRGGSEVIGRSLLTLFREDAAPASIADIDDHFVNIDGRWRIQQRTITPIFNKV